MCDKTDNFVLQKIVLNADTLEVLTWFSGLTQGTLTTYTALLDNSIS